MIKLMFTLARNIYDQVEADSKRKGITIQAHLRNIIAEYYEAKKTN